jgi:hypothetical protein
MDPGNQGPATDTALQEMLGYLNFSSGTPDARFQQNVDLVFRALGAEGQTTPCQALATSLRSQLDALRRTSDAFSEVGQAAAAIDIALNRFLPAYRQFHRDLLFHQTDALLFNSFFIARAFEAVLAEGGPWDEPDRVVAGALERINDFIGYRPVAVLRTPQKIEPYDHEWCRPVPLYWRGVGFAGGPYEAVLHKAIEILAGTDPALREQACFDLELMDELALDPRAYDFDHPVNKRPNYHFGQWDPHQIDNRGRYRRFVVQQVTIDALMHRLDSESQLPPEELLFEAAAVLAGTMLMAAGISGRGPDTHDSSVTLATLLPQVARYRDQFYQRLLASLIGPHGDRLRAETATMKQPFAAARQHLNHRIARLRARHLQHVHLAQLFAQMGSPEASARQARVLDVPAPRMLADIDGRITLGHQAIERGELAVAADQMPEIEDLLQRAIDCGALIDPWNILGFGGQFSLFPAVENSVRDHRADQLIRLMQRIFMFYARLQGQAAAGGQAELETLASGRLATLARWWDKFATLDVSGIQSISGRETYESSNHVARALGAWHRAGTAAGNLAFWRQHAAEFNSPKAYALVVRALLEQEDLVASMALLVQWLSQAEQAPLEDGEHSFGTLAVRWISQANQELGGCSGQAVETSDKWPLVRRFFDYLEANAEEYWVVPRFEAGTSVELEGHSLDDLDEDLDEDLYGAAYDEVTYRDSTADGHEGEMLEGAGQSTDYELDFEQARLGKRLAFLAVVAELWKRAATHLAADSKLAPLDGDQKAALEGWLAQAAANQAGLQRLLSAIDGHCIPAPRSTHESLVEYDRRRMLKESLLDKTVGNSVAMAEAARRIRLLLGPNSSGPIEPWEAAATELLRAVSRGAIDSVRDQFPGMLEEVRKKPLLYIPLARQGDPQRIVSARNLHHVLRDLLHRLPRLGLLRETCHTIEAAQAMEREHPVGPGGVTEFDRLFEVGYQAIVECLIVAADQADQRRSPFRATATRSDSDLVDSLQIVTESLLKRWLVHSRSLRLSVLEKVSSDDAWRSLVRFIEKYGHDLFTQMFLNLGNIRAVLHQGVPAWLESLEEHGDRDDSPRLVEALDREIPRSEAIAHLELVLEAIADNYAEYLDYNTTTTQSDRGELLYTLLDFLRLKATYDRVAWNLRPAIMAHEILMRRGRTAAAELWRRALVDRTSQAADRQLNRLAELGKQYGMRLSTVYDRMSERFVQPLAIDRLRSLIRPAMQELHCGGRSTSFELLEQEIEEFSQTPIGVGIDVPAWLMALAQEVGQVKLCQSGDISEEPPPTSVPLSLDDIQQQLRQWDEAS